MIFENKVGIMKCYKSTAPKDDIHQKKLEAHNKLQEIEVREMGGKTIKLKPLINENRFQYIEM